jgi:regulatory protein
MQAQREPEAFEEAGSARVARPVSLRTRALKLLARRDYSAVELEQRLGPHAADPAELEALLHELRRLGWLSEERVAEQVVRKGASRFGARRILRELEERGVDAAVTERLRGELRESELQRAQTVWAKRFGRLPEDLRERAKQARFLESRGFDADVIRRVLRGLAEE